MRWHREPLHVVCLAISTHVSMAAAQPALNDGQATHEGGVFKLPSRPNPKDQYSIVILAGGKETTHSLPAGVNVVQFNTKALPEGSWTWRYVLSKSELPNLEVLQPLDESFTYERWARYDSAVLIVVKQVPGAARYRLTTEPSKERSAAGEKFGKEVTEVIEGDAMGAGCNCVTALWRGKQGERMRWRMTALAEDGTPIAESERRIVEVEASRLKVWSDMGLRIQRSDTLSADNASKPALFGYQSAQKGSDKTRSTAYTAEFAVVYVGKTIDDAHTLAPRASLEARLNSSGSGKENDALRLRAGFEKVYLAPFILTTGLKYDTERKTGTKKGSVEFVFTPTFDFLWKYWGSSRGKVDAAGNYEVRPAIQGQWGVQFGAEFGRTFDAGSSTEIGRSLSRGRVDLRLDGQLNFLASALRVPNFGIYAQSTYWRLAHQVADEFSYSRAGASVKLTPELSLELAYTVGRDAPTFAHTRSGLIGLCVQLAGP